MEILPPSISVTNLSSWQLRYNSGVAFLASSVSCLKRLLLGNGTCELG